MSPALNVPPEQLALGQLALALVLGVLGLTLLLPRPRGRSVALGAALSLMSLVVGTLFLATTFSLPFTEYVGPALFWLFGGAALTFAGILVAQANPARGAMAFAFVILSTCGLFLLLAAPFLMAATVIVYMGAIVVTFLFVLMLSHSKGPSDENDRSREPFLGSLAGFAFTGLVLFTLYLDQSRANDPLPVVGVTARDSGHLLEAARSFEQAVATEDAAERETLVASAVRSLEPVVGGPPQSRFPATDTQADLPLQSRLTVAKSDTRLSALAAQAEALAATTARVSAAGGSADSALLAQAREQSLLLAGRGELPARNVSALGLTLYSDYLTSIELAGALLLVATVGAVAIANRRGVPG